MDKTRNGEKYMKKIIIAMVVLLMALPAIAQLTTPTDIDDYSVTDNSVSDDHSVQYHISLGDGNSIIVFGDGNTIYLPKNDPVEITPNQVTFSGDVVRVVLTDTDIITDGVTSRFKKVVLILGKDGWDVVWWEQ